MGQACIALTPHVEAEDSGWRTRFTHPPGAPM